MKIHSKFSFGFFGGMIVGDLLFGREPRSLLTSDVEIITTAVISGYALAYLEYCSHDPAHRKMDSFDNIGAFIIDTFELSLSLPLGIWSLANAIQGKGISLVDAMKISAFILGCVCEALSRINDIAEDGQLRRLRL